MKFIDNSDEAIKAKDEAIKQALIAIGITAEKFAKEDCPTDTGLLKNSITWALSGEQPKKLRYASTPKKGRPRKTGEYSGTVGEKGKNAVFIGTNVKYAPSVEFDEKLTHTSGKAHFLRDAATTHSDKYKKIVEKYIKPAHR